MNRLEERLSWDIEQQELPLYKNDSASPWLIAPPKIILAMRKMQNAGQRLGDTLSINMGIKTAANNIFLVDMFEATDIPDVVLVTTERGEKVRIERELLRPLVKGENIDAWRYEVENYIIWTHDDNGSVRERGQLPPYAEEYFDRDDIKKTLLHRSDYKEGQPPWVIFRVSKDKLEDKVAWQKISKAVEATYLPSEHEDASLGFRKLIADSSLYFISVKNRKLGYALAGILNSTPVRTYAATYVNRTGAAYCQYFAWVIGLIPVPNKVIEKHATKVVSKKLHRKAGEDVRALRKLDEIAAKLYGLTKNELRIMCKFLSFFTK